MLLSNPDIIRFINCQFLKEWYQSLKKISPEAPQKQIDELLSAAFVISTKESINLGLPDFPFDNLVKGVKILERNPYLSTIDILTRLYPYKTFLNEQISNFESLLSTFNISNSLNQQQPITKIADFLRKNDSKTYIETPGQNILLEAMVQTEEITDFCLIGPKGCGKTMLVEKMAEICGKEVENIVLYQDMTARDLVQQRTTLESGDTVWTVSPLIQAALDGKIAVLDGIDRIHPSTLSVLHR